jgi:hypothetical protein
LTVLSFPEETNLAAILVITALYNYYIQNHGDQIFQLKCTRKLPVKWEQWNTELPSDKFLRGQAATTRDQLVVGGFEGNVHLLSLDLHDHHRVSEWKTITRQAGDILALDCTSNECFAMIYDKMASSTVIESFDPGCLTDWRSVTVLPEEFQSLSDVTLVVHNHLLFLVGGRTKSGQCVTKVCVRDLRLDRYTPFDTLPDLITARSSCSALVIGDTLFVGGGRGSEGVFINQVEALNIGRPNERWQMVTPTTRYDPTLVQFCGKLLALGGLTEKTWSHSATISSSAELLEDSISTKWFPLPDMRNRWMSHGAAGCGNLLIVAGGLSSCRYVIESTKLSSKDCSGLW